MFTLPNRMRNHAFLLAGLFFCVPAFSVDTIGYSEIGDSLIASYGVVEPVTSSVNDSNQKKPKLAFITFTAQQLREKVFSLLSKNDANEAKSNRTQLVKTNLKDLDVYLGRGQNTQAHLLNAVDNTATIIGQAGLARMLANPLTQKSELANRQSLVKELIENPELLAQVEAILQQVKKSEQAFFSFWQETDKVTADYIQSLYWNNRFLKSLNDYSLGLEASVRLGNLGTAFDCTKLYTYYLLTVYGFQHIEYLTAQKMDPGVITSGQVQAPSFIRAVKTSAKSAFNMFNPVAYVKQVNYLKSEDFIKNATGVLIQQTGRLPQASELNLQRKVCYGLLSVQAAGALFFGVQQGLETKKAVSNAIQVRDAHNYMQSRMIGVASIVDGVKKITDLASSNPVVANGLFKLAQGKALFNSGNTEFSQLITLLQTTTFSGSASFFSLTGRVLAAHKLMQAHKESFAPALELIGELDAVVSAAKLYNKMKNERVVYSLVQFEESNAPHIALTELWNPFVDTQVVVTNDIELGAADQKRVMLITGSNTGGKSTVLKAVSIAQLLAHTLTVVPASQATITPLVISASSMNISDDTAAGNSLFKSEVLRAQSLVGLSDSLQSNEFAFIVVDELFTGTNATKGAQAAYKVVNHIAQNNNVVMLIATHFPLLTELEEKTNGVCKNYNLDIQKDEQGNLVRSFKLNEGISSSNVAEDILQAEMSNIDFSLQV